MNTRSTASQRRALVARLATNLETAGFTPSALRHHWTRSFGDLHQVVGLLHRIENFDGDWSIGWGLVHGEVCDTLGLRWAQPLLVADALVCGSVQQLPEVRRRWVGSKERFETARWDRSTDEYLRLVDSRSSLLLQWLDAVIEPVQVADLLCDTAAAPRQRRLDFVFETDFIRFAAIGAMFAATTGEDRRPLVRSLWEAVRRNDRSAEYEVRVFQPLLSAITQLLGEGR